MNFNDLKSFGFRYCGKVPCTEYSNVTIHTYTFSYKILDNKNIYIVRIEEHKQHFLIVKFYPKLWKNRKDMKYVELTNHNKARRIINTCIDIMLDIAKRRENACFAFIGSPNLSELQRGEDRFLKTKRFRVYSRYVLNFFNPENYEHIVDEHKSSYAIINKKALFKNPYLKSELIQYFDERYQIDNMFSSLTA